MPNCDMGSRGPFTQSAQTQIRGGTFQTSPGRLPFVIYRGAATTPPSAQTTTAGRGLSLNRLPVKNLYLSHQGDVWPTRRSSSKHASLMRPR
jgi:hypothetical protein